MGSLKSATFSQFNGLRTDLPESKCPADYSPDCADLVYRPGEAATRPPFRVVYTLPSAVVFEQAFTGRDGSLYTLVVTADGAMWSLAADGAYTQLDSVQAGSQVQAVSAYGRLYMAFYNAQGGCDAPRQWDGKKLYRVAQGGPGAASSFAPAAVSGDDYPINTITQPDSHSRGFSYFLQSAGVGNNTTPGNNATVYYSDSTLGGQDTDLVDAFNSGFPVYLYFSFTGAPETIGPQVVLVTGVGEATPPTQPRAFFYFTYTTSSTALTYYRGSGQPSYTANYQRTLATVTTTVPVPEVAIGDSVSITGSSQSGWNSTWPIQQTPGSGSVSITQTQLTGGVASYNYVVSTGTAPTAGQEITVTGTLNAGGALNVTNGTIATCTGGTVGTFTINGFTAPDAASATESGAGVTAGTIFAIEPALLLVGTPTSPIYGNATGGFLIFAGDVAIISPGKRQGVVFYITQTGLTTCPGPIASFTVPQNTNAIEVTGLPIGGPDVVARGVAFTGADGSEFFYLPVPPFVNGAVLGTSTVVNDNTSTSATFNFTDQDLLSGLDIGPERPGNNLFAQVTLDTPSGVEWYGDRLFWWGGRNKVTSLQNMEMDGGTAHGSTAPLGWTMVGTGGGMTTLGSAPVYSVSGGTGEIRQGAATTANGSPITQANQLYAFRLWSNGGGGTAVATLSSASTSFSATATLSLGAAGYVQAIFSAALPATVPADLELDWKLSSGTAAVRDFQLIYATNPNRNPVARASYVANPEAYDQNTGNIGPNDDPGALRAMFVLQESLHFVTDTSLYYVIQIGNSEPSSWYPDRIAERCGAFANAVTTGRGWAAWAGPLGAFRYSGGVPINLTNLIAPTWRGLSNVFCVQDDPSFQRVYFGVSRTSGNSLFVFDYHEMQEGGPGKWCEWKRPVDWISYGAEARFAFGSKLYRLDTGSGVADDDLGDIGGYITLPAVASSAFQKDYSQLLLNITGAGVLTPFLYAKNTANLSKTLGAQELSTLRDIVGEWPVNQRGRLLFVKLGQPGVQFAVQDVTCAYQIDANAPLSGVR